MTQHATEKLGSLNDFAEKAGVDPRAPATFEAYSKKLGEYRDDIAEGLGISLIEVHETPNPLATETPSLAA